MQFFQIMTIRLQRLCSELWLTSKLECFLWKIKELLAVGYFCKTLHFRCLTGLWYASGLLKDTHREKAPWNKTPALTKSMNMDIWVFGTSNQLFTRDSESGTKFLGFTPCKAKQPLWGMELQEKKNKKDYRIQKVCLERTYS